MAGQLFIEIHPFHAITLYPYVASKSTPAQDAIFAHPRLFTEELFVGIRGQKFKLSVLGVLRFILKNGVGRCHFNTINVTLTPLNPENVRLMLKTLALPALTRAAGCQNCAVMHEPDQFYATGIDGSRRATWFRNLIGKWFIRLFDERYVLAPEVAAFLAAKGVATKLLPAQPLKQFAATIPQHAGRTRPNGIVLCWVGPVMSNRRDWRPLLTLDREFLQSRCVSIAMLCDMSVSDGPVLKAAIQERGLDKHFVMFDSRPGDEDLFWWVNQADAVLCLYGRPEYGTTKTSGARYLAAAFEKPYISIADTATLFDNNGTKLATSETLAECIESIERKR